MPAITRLSRLGREHTRDDGSRRRAMDAVLVSFGQVEIDGRRFDHDVVIEGGRIRKRKKGPSKVYRDRYGHTPLSVNEAIPWSARRLIVWTGASGAPPIMPEL